MMGAKRRSTQPGLGKARGDAVTKSEPPQSVATRRSRPPAATESPKLPRSTRPPPRPSARPSAPPKTKGASSLPPKASERRPRPSREALRVDQVGDVAAALSARVQVGARPRVIKTRLELGAAPIDHRDAFVLSLIDGRMTVQELVDVSGMAEDEVLTILARLRRLGILAL